MFLQELNDHDNIIRRGAAPPGQHLSHHLQLVTAKEQPCCG
jgi:hypothetical protein